MVQQRSSITSKILNRKMLICIFTGFSSGLPLYFIIQLIPLWLHYEHVQKSYISYVLLASLPYSWKFLWAPLVDRLVPPFLGRRRGWMLIAQLVLFMLFCAFGFIDPTTKAGFALVLITAFGFTLCSATLDVVLDAFRREILNDEELGLGNSIHVSAYRIAGFVPGAFSLILSDYISWSWVFVITGLFVIPGICMTLFIAKEPKLDLKTVEKQSFEQTITAPFIEFFKRKSTWYAISVLAFIFFYKFGDSMATALISVFYADMGFSKTNIAVVVKNSTVWSMVISGILGGVIMLKIGINRSLWLFGFVQMFTILGFALLAHAGPFDHIGTKEILMLTGVVIAEYAGVGLGTAAFVSFIARETNPLYTATQFALFSSLAALPRTLFNSQAGQLIEHFGYYHYFIFCFCLAIPGMLLLFWVAPWRERKKKQN